MLYRAGAKVPLKHPSPPIFERVEPALCCPKNGKTSQGWFWVFSKKKQNHPAEREEKREEENNNPCIHVVMLLLICWHEIS